MAEELRGAVLDNMFMGDTCNLNKSRGNYRLYYRVPANVESFEIKVQYYCIEISSYSISPCLTGLGSVLVVVLLPQVEIPDDFKQEPQPVFSETVNLASPPVSASSSTSSGDSSLIWFPIFFFGSRKHHQSNTRDFKQAISASKKTASCIYSICTLTYSQSLTCMQSHTQK